MYLVKEQSRFMIDVEIAGVTNKKQIVMQCSVPEQITIKEAIERSGILEQFPELPELNQFSNQGFAVGVFSKIVELDTIVKSGDRIEIYWPLKQSAMDARRERIKQKKACS